MSEANLDLVRSLYDAWGRGDYSSVEWADPEIEFAVADGPVPLAFKGLAEVGEGWREFLETWEEWRVEPLEYLQLDDERVLVPVTLSGRGRASGLDVGLMRAEGANLFQIRKGKVVRLVLYWNRERAFADLGPIPKDASS